MKYYRHILFQEKGNQIENMKGDVKINIHMKEHNLYKRNNLDIICCKKISLKEALCGFSFELKLLNGKNIEIHSKTETNHMIIKPNYKKVVSGAGFQKNNEKGNLIIEFEILFPDKLSKEQVEQLKDIL